MDMQSIEVAIYLILILYGAVFRDTIIHRRLSWVYALLIGLGALTLGVRTSFVIFFVLVPLLAAWRVLHTRLQNRMA